MRFASAALSLAMLGLGSVSVSAKPHLPAAPPAPPEQDGRLTRTVLRSLPTPPAKPAPLKVRSGGRAGTAQSWLAQAA